MKKYNTPEIEFDIFNTEEIAANFATSGDLDGDIITAKIGFDGLL